ncbi:hypothetical protein D9C10_13450 [Bacillus subtilis subsp. subtilis]|nr:hypothetical protein D9C10_13450 [Bacillus subtilis subsp. subtilis]
MGALFLHLKPDEYLKKLYKTKKLVEKTSFSLQADRFHIKRSFSISFNSHSHFCKNRTASCLITAVSKCPEAERTTR